MYKICKYYLKPKDVSSSNVLLFKLREDRNCPDGLDRLMIYRSSCQWLKKCDFEINSALETLEAYLHEGNNVAAWIETDPEVPCLFYSGALQDL